MIENVVRDHRWNACLSGKIGKLVKPQLIVRPTPQRQGEIRAVTEILTQTAKSYGAKLISKIRHKDDQQPFAVGHEVLPAEVTLSFSSASLAQRQQSAKPGVGGTVSRIDKAGDIIAQIETAAYDEPDARIFRRLMRPNDTGQTVVISYSQRLDTKCCSCSK